MQIYETEKLPCIDDVLKYKVFIKIKSLKYNQFSSEQDGVHNGTTIFYATKKYV